MIPNERSLNLSTCVAIVVYEVVRKMIGNGQALVDDCGRLIDPSES
jgi:tRNA C32,U32 (ribose-2'-O)-methylase TrmJ